MVFVVRFLIYVRNTAGLKNSQFIRSRKAEFKSANNIKASILKKKKTYMGGGEELHNT